MINDDVLFIINTRNYHNYNLKQFEQNSKINFANFYQINNNT